MSRLPMLAFVGCLLVAVAPEGLAQTSASADAYQPRDFQAEAALRDRVQAAIDDALGRDARRIVIEVRYGNVFLSGKVSDWRSRARAADAAGGVPGVQNVSTKKLYAGRI